MFPVWKRPALESLPPSIVTPLAREGRAESFFKLSGLLAGAGDYSSATVKIDVAMVFKSISDMNFNLQRFESMPGVVSMAPWGEGKAVITIDNQYYPSVEAAAKALAEQESSNNSGGADRGTLR
ncbi:hypothetical protein T484DRAFT_1906689 [Baffinella frigidus]|nr:hypothetical protein T484DRAFT_1906689 [Cryptophyta sp. CCMP2293]